MVRLRVSPVVRVHLVHISRKVVLLVGTRQILGAWRGKGKVLGER